MPIYEYQCKKCQHRFEKIKKFSDPLERKCPKCGGPVERLVHAPAVHFKGSGWYVTDYASKSGKGDKTEAKADSGNDAVPSPAEKSGAKSEKSDTKPSKKK